MIAYSDICDRICIITFYAEKIFFFSTDDCSPPTAKIRKNVVCEKLNVLKQYCTYANIVTRFYRRTLTGKLVRAIRNGSPWFPIIFPAKHLLTVRPFAKAAEEKVASALTGLQAERFSMS